MRLVFRSLRDPSPEHGAAVIIELALGIGRRHALLDIGVPNAAHELTRARVTGHDRSHPIALGDRDRANIEPQIRLTRVPIRPMTGQATIRKNGPNIPVELDRLRKLDPGLGTPNRRHQDPTPSQLHVAQILSPAPTPSNRNPAANSRSPT